MSYYLKFWENYFNFSGRSQRAEYWTPLLINSFLFIILVSLEMRFIAGMFILSQVIPSWSVSVRRLHDIGKSGWWLLLWIVSLLLYQYTFYILKTQIPYLAKIPSDIRILGVLSIIGFLSFLILMMLNSQKEKNKYGENPKNTDLVSPKEKLKSLL